MVVSSWQYHPPDDLTEVDGDKLTSYVTFDVMKKRAPTKKGLACRFTCEFIFDKALLLEYVAENSYVIDLEDVIDRNELETMIRFAYVQYKEIFDIRKLATVLHNKTLLPFDESKYDLDPVLELLK